MTTPSIDTAGLLAQAPDAVIFAGVDGAVRYWNEAAERVFGYTAEAIVGENLDLIIPESFRGAHWTGFERALGDGKTKYEGQSLPTKAQRRDGTEIYVELSFSIVKDADGVVIGALAHARDITERFARDREMRRKVRDLEARLAALESPSPSSAVTGENS